MHWELLGILPFFGGRGKGVLPSSCHSHFACFVLGGWVEPHDNVFGFRFSIFRGRGKGLEIRLPVVNMRLLFCRGGGGAC